MKVFIGFDGTYYKPNRDVDNGLDLIYLLRSGQINLVGITTTFGNNDIETVYKDTLKLIKGLQLDSIPHVKGVKEIE